MRVRATFKWRKETENGWTETVCAGEVTGGNLVINCPSKWGLGPRPIIVVEDISVTVVEDAT